MSIRTARDTPRYDATVQRSVKNVYHRDPIVIPQLFDDGPPPWYRRRSGIALGSIALLSVAGLAFAVKSYGIAGTAQRAASFGATVLRGFTRIVG